VQGGLVFSVLMVLEITVDFNDDRVQDSGNLLEPVSEITDSNTCSNLVSIGFVNADAFSGSDPGDSDVGGSECTAVACIEYQSCGSTLSCSWRETCAGCSCGFEQTGFGGSDRCG
jgi:hypothetical protein